MMLNAVDCVKKAATAACDKEAAEHFYHHRCYCDLLVLYKKEECKLLKQDLPCVMKEISIFRMSLGNEDIKMTEWKFHNALTFFRLITVSSFTTFTKNK